MDTQNPFGYPISDYIEVITVAAAAGLVRYMNSKEKFRWLSFLIAIVTAAFTGVMTFWLAKGNGNMEGPMLAFVVGVSGFMGTTAWAIFETLWKKRFEFLLLLSPERPDMRTTQHGASLELEESETHIKLGTRDTTSAKEDV